MSTSLRTRAEALAGGLPPLLVAAERLAATVMPGEHGRRRGGPGDEFWQYRPAAPGDPVRLIDWRRSARSDMHFVREKEWQAVQSVLFWVDRGQSMTFAGAPGRVAKRERAGVLALALALLLARGGERTGLWGEGPPRAGRARLTRIAARLAAPADAAEHGAPPLEEPPEFARALFLSDFLGPLAPVREALHRAADRGVAGILCQILDPAEEAFPFDGRVIFQSVTGALRHETREAGALRARYLDRLAARRDELRLLTRDTGWQFLAHHTDESAAAALLWLYHALAGGG